MTGEGFSVLVVCSGNICRSPIAEQALRARVNGAGVLFGSAGTIARDGNEMTDEAALLSRRLGGDPSGHLSRRLTPAMIQESGLVLTAAREHRARVVEAFPRASAYTFTLRQFARLLALGGAPAATSGSHLVAQVAARRGYAPPAAPDADDVPDPYRRPMAEYELAAALIDEALAEIAPALSRLS
jgi:protein-tyrosine phosphatase